jgi:hypothetical protein
MFKTFTPTDAELAAGALEPDRALEAADALWDDGVVVLTGVVDLDHVEALRLRMEDDIPAIVAKGRTNGPPGHYQQGPPVVAPHVFADIVANPIAAQVAGTAVGAKLQLTLLTGNTILRNTDPQHLHRDQGNLWADADQTHRPSNISVHVPLSTIDDTNGSTEVWPGTHRLAHEGPVPADAKALEARAAVAPPCQVACPAGGIILRDARAWHRGMPNGTDRPRLMIGMIYAAAWARSARIPFHRSAEPALEDAPIEIRPRWVESDHDHLRDWRDPA